MLRNTREERARTHLADVGAGGLAERRDGVDGRDALREERVGRELGELCGPEVGREDALARDPVRVHVGQRLDGQLPRLGLSASDQDLQGGEEGGEAPRVRRVDGWNGTDVC